MRERIERMRNSPSILRRGIWGLCKFSSRILPAQKRGEIIMWLKRTIRYRPRYCRKVSGWGLNVEERSPRIIVSLTSYPKRVKTISSVVIALLNQTLKPDAVILWLGEQKFPGKENDLPKELLALRKYGLTIAWCKDLRSYTKLIPALKAYPEDIIITVDDDTYYSPYLVERLYCSYEGDKKSVHSNYVRRIGHGADGTIAPYRAWVADRTEGAKSYANLLLGYSGVLYPPHVLDKEVIEIEKFQRIAPIADDLWLWAMAVKAGAPIRCVAGNSKVLTCDYSADQEGALMNENVMGEGLNDKQFNAILSEYPIAFIV